MHEYSNYRNVLTGPNDDGSRLVIDGHGPVVGGDREAAPHLVQAAVHGTGLTAAARIRLAGIGVRLLAPGGRVGLSQGRVRSTV